MRGFDKAKSVRPPVGPAVPDDGILQSSDGEAVEDTQAHAWELRHSKQNDYAHASDESDGPRPHGLLIPMNVVTAF